MYFKVNFLFDIRKCTTLKMCLETVMKVYTKYTTWPFI